MKQQAQPRDPLIHHPPPTHPYPPTPTHPRPSKADWSSSDWSASKTPRAQRSPTRSRTAPTRASASSSSRATTRRRRRRSAGTSGCWRRGRRRRGAASRGAASRVRGVGCGVGLGWGAGVGGVWVFGRGKTAGHAHSDTIPRPLHNTAQHIRVNAPTHIHTRVSQSHPTPHQPATNPTQRRAPQAEAAGGALRRHLAGLLPRGAAPQAGHRAAAQGAGGGGGDDGGRRERCGFWGAVCGVVWGCEGLGVGGGAEFSRGRNCGAERQRRLWMCSYRGRRAAFLRLGFLRGWERTAAPALASSGPFTAHQQPLTSSLGPPAPHQPPSTQTHPPSSWPTSASPWASPAPRCARSTVNSIRTCIFALAALLQLWLQSAPALLSSRAQHTSPSPQSPNSTLTPTPTPRLPRKPPT